MKILGRRFRKLQEPLQRSAVEKAYQAFKRKISALEQTVKRLFNRSRNTLPPREIHARSISKLQVPSALYGLNPQSEPDVIYIEKQVRDQQTCGTHAANAFFGKHALNPYNVYEQKDVEVLLQRMQERCLRATAEEKLPPASQLTLHNALYDESLIEALDNFQGDRMILASGLSHHFVTCVKGESGQWYVVDSMNHGKKIRVDSPASYLKLLYYGRDPEQMELEEKIVSVIHLKGENMPGVEQD
ncbi:hypothetical protein [Parendozoicomonas sp. Alg238-R29]|uniref:hypothetical protein n=1 Tax=Parendozoicomonas sp. Alg238-R29 TaxID=2993446 RepID=UPI00248DAFB3|nr:hypothetical protein [Parendozoicomonas sp. Alg238-R29]